MLAVSMSPPVLHYSMVQKRPKLSLKTSELPITYGTSSRGLLTIATPSAAVTPTTYNTFNNTFDLTHRPSPTSATAPPSIIRTASVRDCVSRSQSPGPIRIDVAYAVNLPYGIKPILRNSPFPRVRNNSISASPRSTTRRVFFPAPKQVSFRNTIEEEIVTKVYTARHSDLFQSTSIESQVEECKDVSKDQQTTVVSSKQSKIGLSVTVCSSSQQRRTRNRPDFRPLVSIDASMVSSEDSHSQSVATPAASRKPRRWEWTLAPILPPVVSGPEATATSEPLSSPSDSSPSSSSLSPSSSTSTSTSSSTSPTAKPTITLNTNITSAARKTRNVPVSATPASNCPTKISAPASSPSSVAALPAQPHQSSTVLLPPPHQHGRTISLDGSSPPRKRKAECLLDMSSVASSLAANSHIHAHSHNTDDHVSDADSSGECCSGGALKKRERAVTL